MNSTVRNQILEFLEDPVKWSVTGIEASRKLWLAGLEGVDELGLKRPLLEAQRVAWRGIADQRAALLLGPPGTGKTFALSVMSAGYIIQSAKVGSPCRIFVTAFTRNAIMNLLTAIAGKFPKDAQFPIAFVGNAETKPESDRVGFIDRKTGLDDLQAMVTQPQFVLGATIWGLRRLLKDKKAPLKDLFFDLVLMDEASQLPVSNGLMALSAVSASTRVVIAGDDRQLPPIRTALSPESDPKRLSSSLYDFVKAAGVAEFPLDETFRLNQALADFPERKFYAGKYRSVDEVSSARLALPKGWPEGLPAWVKAALDPENPICILLHDGLPAGTQNNFEVKVVSHLVRALYDADLKGDQALTNSEFWNERLAVISPHRAQNAAIRKALTGHPCAEDAIVETVERIQGRERDAVIISYTVSDSEFAQTEGAFLFSPQRLNVMITRARTKLIVLISRKLLEVVPSDEEVLEAAQHLREFVYDTSELGRVSLSDGEGGQVNVNIRVRSFDPVTSPVDFSDVDSPRQERLPDYTKQLEQMFGAIQKLALESKYGSARDFDLKKPLVLKTTPSLSDFYPLVALGKVTLEQKPSPYGGFWALTPVDPARVPFPASEDSVRERLEEVIRAVRTGKLAPFYSKVRNRFLWMDEQGTDIFRPVLEKLAMDGLVVLGAEKDTVDLVDLAGPQEMTPLAPPGETLEDADFEVLNKLEDLETRRINFGITESWASVTELTAITGLAKTQILGSIAKLRIHGYLMHEDEGRLRSRMAELARELRYAKQRFEPGDRDKRPYLVRGLKIETIQRQKPVRSVPLSSILSDMALTLPDPDVRVVLDSVQAMLASRWNVSDPLMAGFQGRALSAIFKAWLGHTDLQSFVITSDTGSGKTEAACLPMIAGAAVDVKKGILGTRAILVYPRIRLAANQAQRIVGYLAALNQQPGITPLSIGLQNGSVPSDLRGLREREKEEWGPAGGGLTFPFFGCPQLNCGNDLILQIRAGHEGCRDRLFCPACQWAYDSWIGDKVSLRENPPHFFLPVTESLHQWQQNSQYGMLFGDSPKWAPPRAVMADEIHLYSHIHGAQVGLTLRRLLARIQINSLDKKPPLAVGMSATLGNPELIWGELIGRSPVTSLFVEPTERRINARGREYFYFIQPEVESRGKDIAGASTTIQSLMCLAHGIRRRTGAEGGFRAVVFLDSIDKVKRLHGDYQDAEEKGLSQLRTYLYDDDPGTGSARRECCGEPLCCDRFQEGECWYFAAQDEFQWTAQGRYRRNRHLSVCPSPIYSGTKGRAETMMRQSDIVFSTSTLEVGYDDPDITLVYQHYSPQNLASFVQRKGRGGRGSDDRPVTGVTLSVYSPRDSFYFRRPSQMLDAAHFEVPLNLSNYFVLRGQVASGLLDVIARCRSQRLESALDTDMQFQSFATNLASEFLSFAFGYKVLETLGCNSLSEFWKEILAEAINTPDLSREPKEWAEALPSVPVRLFDSINLPMLTVEYQDDSGQIQSRTEDISQAFYLGTPGNITRRYGHQKVHWIRPTEGHSVFLPLESYKHSQGFSIFDDDTGQKLRRELPALVRDQLGDAIYPKICRPGAIRFEDAGKIRGTGWTSAWRYDPATKSIESAEMPAAAKSPGIEIGPKSRGSLRGFVIVSADSDKAETLRLENLETFISKIEIFRGTRSGKTTGLKVARVYWGADIELQLDDPKIREANMTQTFRYPKSEQTLLHGYQVETEGIRLHLHSSVLSGFVDTEFKRLVAQESELKTMKGRFLAHLAETRLTAKGFNGYEANRLCELLVSAASQPEGREALRKLQKRWDPKALMQLLKSSFNKSLHWHPLLSERRVEKLSTILESPSFRELFNQLMSDVGSEELFRQYLRSLVVQGLCHRFRDLFVLRGYGDERKVIAHAKLPIQFGEDAEDIITVAENGSHGDGTTRAFLHTFHSTAQEWLDSGLIDCPNASEDRLLDAVFRREERHAAWRHLDPRSSDQMKELVEDLNLGATSGSGLGRVIQVFYGSETIGAECFDFYDLYREIGLVAQSLEADFKREPMTWELVSEVVTRANITDDSTCPRLQALLMAYRSLEDVSAEESMSPEARLADQVFRLSGKLCPDGCEACLYGESHLMAATAARNSLSRNLLERFGAFVKGV